MPTNRALKALSPSDLMRLTRHLVRLKVERGDILISQGALVDQVFFPETALLTNVVTFSDGRSAEAYLTGPEGVAGLMASLAQAPSAWSVVVKAPGTVHALPADVLAETVDTSRTLRAKLHGLANEDHARAVAGMACALLHTVTQRLAGFILTTCDQVGTDELRLTQEEIAEILNVQRTTVNGSARELKTAKAVRYLRGQIRILDRAVLADLACECYRPLAQARPRAVTGAPGVHPSA